MSSPRWQFTLRRLMAIVALAAVPGVTADRCGRRVRRGVDREGEPPGEPAPGGGSAGASPSRRIGAAGNPHQSKVTTAVPIWLVMVAPRFLGEVLDDTFYPAMTSFTRTWDAGPVPKIDGRLNAGHIRPTLIDESFRTILGADTPARDDAETRNR